MRVYDGHCDDGRMHCMSQSHGGYMRFDEAEGEVVERSRCRIVDLGTPLGSDVCIGKMELETVLEIRSHCVCMEQEMVFLSRIRYEFALEEVHEIHSHVFEEQARSQYYRVCPEDSVKVLEMMRDCLAFVVLLV